MVLVPEVTEQVVGIVNPVGNTIVILLLVVKLWAGVKVNVIEVVEETTLVPGVILSNEMLPAVAVKVNPVNN